MNNILEVRNLSIAYDGKNILENINFNVIEGDFLVIFGENGSGKSSLAKALCSLKAPSSGELVFSVGYAKNSTGYLPQSGPARQDFPASAWEVVLSGCLGKMSFRPFYTKKEKEDAKKNMELLSVYDLKNESFCNLSGGQQQRVLLARALCSAHRLLVLDEPVSGLDSAATASFYDALRRINESGTAVIMVSHDVTASLALAKHVLRLGNNTALFFGDAESYKKTLY